MAELENLTLKVKIQDLNTFKDLVEAIATWAAEAVTRPTLTDAEAALLDAADTLTFGEADDGE